jgi:hypothetical protein
MKLMTPNKYNQALKEIPKGLSVEVLKEIKTIQESEKDQYFYLGIKAQKSKDGMNMNYSASPQFVNKKSYEKMKKQIEDKRFKSMFADKFTKVILLHDPAYKAPAAKKKAVDETPAEEK